ncbi:MAG TPA: gliding motility-associated C-terminal domain-containing protein [Saprospiraceae bacterium]|nr:gliding motility-associated C-terminal domain-containing protein [Saprospiraceae bacterium]
MKKNILLLFLIFAIVFALHAQPIPCGPAPEMTSFCDEACIICDIDGFTGINDDPAQGQAPPGFCTNIVHHMQWIGFIAGSTNLTLEVSVFNCQVGQGLEVGIYKSLNCQTFQLVSNCDTDLPPNTTTTFTNTVPLTVGQYYYFVMDGNMGDVCNYTIHVVSGTTNVSALATSGVLAGDAKACLESPSVYTLSPPVGATVFEWSLDGAQLSTGPDTSVVVNWTSPGTYQLCATASNTCDTAAPACRTVVVTGIPPTLIPATICAGECYGVGDTVLCDPGIYDFHYTGTEGCDSLVRVTLDVLPVASASLDLFICKDDSIYIGDQAYFESGQYQKILTSGNGCDSIVNLDLQVVVCEIQGDLNAGPTICHGTDSGSFQFSIDNGTPPFQYSWTRIGSGGPSGNGMLANLHQVETVGNLPAGTYFVTVSDNFGNDVILFGDVTEPPPLGADVQIKMYNGFHVSCFGTTDGALDLTLSGGVPPWSIMWNNGSQSTQLKNLSAGIYTCTVADANGCTLVVQADLTTPEKLIADIQFDKPGCDGLNTGSVEVPATEGGTAPYAYSLSGNGFGITSEFKDLPPGNYTLTVRDANGCTFAESATFATPLIPVIDLGPDLTVDLGESVRTKLLFNVPLDTFIWSPLPGLSCYDCPQPEATPYHTTTYILTVEAPGGCIDRDSVTVIVQPNRDVYVPNIFSPDNDGNNEVFTVYGGQEVLKIRNLWVYSRWGELVFQREGLAANDEQGGWDGTFRGKPMSPGVFAWVAEVEFLDGVVVQYEGSVTIVR